MVTKDYIDELKKTDLSKLYSVINNSNGTELHFIFENLGYLPSNFNGDILAPFIVHSNDKVRFWAVKNIGKLSNPEFIGILKRTAKHDNDSMIRREAVSSIGRMRTKKAIPSLVELLEDSDPKIILQAIRALLVFKSDVKVQDALKPLVNHPNEMVQSVIKKEFFKVNEIKKQKPHPTSPNYLKNLVVYGDVRETLKEVPD